MKLIGETIEQCKDILRSEWGDCIDDIMREVTKSNIKKMTSTFFINEYCDNEGEPSDRILSGLKALYPDIYKHIPNKIYSWLESRGLYNLANLLGILKINIEE